MYEIDTADDGEVVVKDSTGKIVKKGKKREVENWLDWKENQKRSCDPEAKD